MTVVGLLLSVLTHVAVSSPWVLIYEFNGWVATQLMAEIHTLQIADSLSSGIEVAVVKLFPGFAGGEPDGAGYEVSADNQSREGKPPTLVCAANVNVARRRAPSESNGMYRMEIAHLALPVARFGDEDANPTIPPKNGASVIPFWTC